MLSSFGIRVSPFVLQGEGRGQNANLTTLSPALVCAGDCLEQTSSGQNWEGLYAWQKGRQSGKESAPGLLAGGNSTGRELGQEQTLWNSLLEEEYEGLTGGMGWHLGHGVAPGVATDVEGEAAEGCGLSSKGGMSSFQSSLTSLEHCPCRLSLTFDSSSST